MTPLDQNIINNNIILIGMPGAGKSTVGVILAKTLGKVFVDTDILLQNKHKLLLQNIIKRNGINTFIKTEGDLVKSLRCHDSVIATGGSVVLCAEAMSHLQSIGTIIYLQLSLGALIKRIKNIETRGIVKTDNQSLDDIYEIRTPLYEGQADIIIKCNNKDVEQIIKEIIAELKKLTNKKFIKINH